MDNIYQYIAHKLPRKFLYFCVIDAWARATTQRYTHLHPDEVTWSMTCKFLDNKPTDNKIIPVGEAEDNHYGKTN
jgi:hypothetical protein